jgi:hypothetical protein
MLQIRPVLSFLFLVSTAQASVPKATALEIQLARGVGAIYGGETRGLMGLLDVRKSSVAKQKIERLVFDFGSQDLKPKLGLAGYYHVEVSNNPPRISIELPQVMSSRITEVELQRRLAGSIHIKRAQIQFDRISQATQINLQLNGPVTARAIQVRNPKVLGKLVVDLFPYKK